MFSETKPVRVIEQSLGRSPSILVLLGLEIRKQCFNCHQVKVSLYIFPREKVGSYRMLWEYHVNDMILIA